MAKNKSDEYLKKYENEVVHIDAFSAGKLGLIQAETVLKIDKLEILCSPFQISMGRAVLLCVLSEREVPFFTHYTKKLSSLKFSFMKGPNNNVPIKFVVWTKINNMTPLKGRQNICMVDLSFKNCPNDLMTIIGQFIEYFENLKQNFETYKNKEIKMEPAAIKDLRFNNYVEATIGDRKLRIRLLSISVNKLLLVVPAIDPSIKKGLQMGCKVFFQKYRVDLKGVVAQTSKVVNGFVKLYYITTFSPELVDILQDYFKVQKYKSL